MGATISEQRSRAQDFVAIYSRTYEASERVVRRGGEAAGRRGPILTTLHIPTRHERSNDCQRRGSSYIGDGGDGHRLL